MSQARIISFSERKRHVAFGRESYTCAGCGGMFTYDPTKDRACVDKDDQKICHTCAGEEELP